MSEVRVGATLLPGFAGVELPDWLAARLRAGLAGVCLFGPNVASREQLRRLTDEIRDCNPRALIAVDEEGGDVTRLHHRSGSPTPGNAWLGRLDDEGCTAAVAAAIAAELRDAGCNLNLAPSADVNCNPDNPVIGVRSFGGDAELVARHTVAWVQGHQSQGVAACAKHFPGHGDTSVDSHHGLPVVDVTVDDLADRELVPFAAAVSADAWAVMTSHVLLPTIDAERPATFSPRILDELLRSGMSFDGVIVSDALDMAGASRDIGIPEAAVRALAAGCDLLCLGTDNSDDQLTKIEEAVASAIRDGAVRAERLDEAAGRVRTLAERVSGSRLLGAGAHAVAPPLPAEHVAAMFEVSPRVRSQLGADDPATWTIASVQTRPNMAVGAAPWGPLAAIDAGDAHWPGELMSVGAGDADAALQGERVVIVGRDNHRHAWVRELVERRRAVGPTIVVDMGWPSADRAYADVATFGASRLLGAALLWLLARLVREGGRAA